MSCADDCCAPRPAGRSVPTGTLAALAGALWAAGTAAGWAGAATAAVVAHAGALLAGGATFVPQSLRALARGRLGVGFLMTTGAVGAVALGELAEAATLALLFSVSEHLERRALARARRDLGALLELTPAMVTRLTAGGAETVALAEVRPGDLLLVRPGERVPTDGVVEEGHSAVDVSALTGESLPREVGPGDQVPAGAVNHHGALRVRALASVERSSLARIVAAVEAALERKGRAQRLAERVAGPLVPGVVVVSVGLAGVGSLAGSPGLWIERALVVLVAAAPCALALSVPVTVTAAVGAAGRRGILFRGGAALEALARIRAVALDKTGTLTANRPRVVEVAPAHGSSSEEVLAVAAALEAASTHPLAAAVLEAAPAARPARVARTLPGRGLSGEVDGVPARLGHPGFVVPVGLEDRVARMEEAGMTVVVVERAGRVLGALGVRDELRPEAERVVAELRGLGVARIVLLSGDHPATAGALGRAAGVAEVAAGLLPEDKARRIAELERELPVAMVGDGINDAPALARATAGVAMGGSGTEVAAASADVVLAGEGLARLPESLAHARRVGRIMTQNLALSAAIVVTLVPLAAAGVLGLGAVVALHELAEIAVIANGLRAGRMRPPSGAGVRAPSTPAPVPAG